MHAPLRRPLVRRLTVLNLLLILFVMMSGFIPLPRDLEQLPPITANGSSLLSGDQPFEVRGVNYIHTTDATPECAVLHFGGDGNCPWDLNAIAADMDRYQALGINTVRIFLNYYVFGGAQELDASYSMAEPLAHLDAFIEVANRRGIYVLPVLLAKYPQDRFGGANAERALDLHVRPIVGHLADRPGILAWDIFNEPDIGSPIDLRCWDWDNADFPLCFPLANERLHFLKTIKDAVKGIDSDRLTTISAAFAKSYFRPIGADLRMADLVDVYTFHYYDNDPYDSGRYAAHWYYGQGFPADLKRGIEELYALQLNKPVIVTELGFPTGEGAQRTTEQLRRDLATARDVVRAENTSGMILWPFQVQPGELVGDLYVPPQ